MEPRIRHALPLLTVLVFSMCIGMANATTIVYQASDLSDVNPGEDLWQYTYMVSDYTFAAQTGFTVFFDASLYGAVDPSPLSPNSDWDVLTWNPDPGLPGDGGYDALSNVENPSLADPFTVSFVWLGAGTPGSQSFNIYDTDFSTIESGSTVPAPATLLLLGTGFVGLITFRRNLKSSR